MLTTISQAYHRVASRRKRADQVLRGIVLSHQALLCTIRLQRLRHYVIVRRQRSVGLVYCMDFLRENLDWLHERLKPLIKGACW